MSVKYHINPNTDRVNICKAKIKCKFTEKNRIEPIHFTNKESAYAYREEILNKKYKNLIKDGLNKKEYSYEIDNKLKNLILDRLDYSYLSSEIENMTIDKDCEFDITLGSSSFTINSDYESPYNQHFFSMGKCGYIAYELHQQTGLPYIIFTDEDKSDISWRGHVGLLTKNNKVLDITGESSIEKIKQRYKIENLSIKIIDDNEFLEVLKVPNKENFYKDVDELEENLIKKFCRDIRHDYLDI